MLVITAAVSMVGDRLREAMVLRGTDQTSLASAVGITQGAISLILKGKTRKSKHLPDLARHLNVSLPWLMGFDEPMEMPTSQLVLLNPNEQDLIDAYRQLPHMHKKAVEDIAESLLITALIAEGWIDASTSKLDDRRKLAREILDDLQKRREAMPQIKKALGLAGQEGDTKS